MMIFKKVFWVGLCGLCFLTFSVANSGGAENTIIFGNLTALTGKAATWGVAMDRGFKYAAEDINSKGGIIVQGKKYDVRVNSYDTQYDSAKAVEAANKAVFGDKIKFVSVLGAGVMGAVQPVLERNKVINMGIFAGGKEFTNAKNPFTFRMMGSSDMIIAGVIPPIYNHYKPQRAAFIMPDDDMGRGDAVVTRSIIKKHSASIEIVAEEFYERSMIDFSPIVTRVLAKRPEIIHTNASPVGSLALISKELRGAGFKGPIEAITAGVSPSELVKASGSKEAVEGTLTRYWAESPSSLWSQLVERYQKQYREPAPAVVDLSYPALIWLAKSIQKANSLDPVKICEVLMSFEGEHAYGWAKMGGKELGYGINTTILMPTPVSITRDGKGEMLCVAKP